MTRNELIIKLAVALYYVGRSADLDYTRNLDNWINDADAALTALLALDQHSPPTQEEPRDWKSELSDRLGEEYMREAQPVHHMTKSEADAIERAFWRSVETVDSAESDICQHADIMNAEESPEQSVSEWQDRKAAPGGEPTNRDKALAGEVIKVSDKRLEEMQRQAVQFEGIDTGHMHWHWAAAVNELIDLRKGGEPKERVCRWTVTNHTVGSGIYERRLYVTGCEDKRHESRETGADFCKYCGGKIITEAQS